MKYDSRERHPSYQRNRVILNFNVINKYAIATRNDNMEILPKCASWNNGGQRIEELANPPLATTAFRSGFLSWYYSLRVRSVMPQARQRHRERAPLADAGRSYARLAAVILDDLFHEVQPEPHAVGPDAPRLIGARELREEARDVGRFDADAAIGHAVDDPGVPGALLNRKLDADVPRRGIFDGVINEVHDHFPDLIRVGVHGLRLRPVRNETERKAFLFRGRLNLGHHFGNNRIECYRLHIVTKTARLHAGKAKEGAYEPDKLLRRDADFFHGFLGKRGDGPERAFQQHRNIALDNRQRRPQLMRRERDELGLRGIELLQFFVRRGKLGRERFDLLTLGHFAVHSPNQKPEESSTRQQDCALQGELGETFCAEKLDKKNGDERRRKNFGGDEADVQNTMFYNGVANGHHHDQRWIWTNPNVAVVSE